MDGAIWLFNAHIAQYPNAGIYQHVPTAPRKLLLHTSEIRKLLGKTKEKGLTLIPISMFFNKRGFVKIELALGKGKKLHDKRNTIKERDWRQEQARLLKR